MFSFSVGKVEITPIVRIEALKDHSKGLKLLTSHTFHVIVVDGG